MGKFWTGVAKFLAFLFSIGFILTAVFSLLLVSVDRQLLSASAYKRAFSQQQIYSRLPRIVAEQLVMTMNYNPCAENPLACEGAAPAFLDCTKKVLGEDRYARLVSGQDQPTDAELQLIQTCAQQYGTNPGPGNENGQVGGPPAFMRNLNVADWESIIARLVPPETLQRMADNLLDQIFAYLNGRQNMVLLDLSGMKERIAGQAGLESVLELIRAQPACTLEQQVQMGNVLLGGQGEMVLCRPPEEILNQLKPMIEDQLKGLVTQMPNEQVLLSPGSGENSTATGPFGGGLSRAFRLAHFIMRLSPIIPLAFLLLVTLLVVRSLKGWLRWWGVPILLSGLFSIMTALLISSSFERIWIGILANRLPAGLSLGLIALGHDLARSLAQAVWGGVFIGGILLGLLGLGMWIGSAFIKTENGSAAPLPPPEPAS